MSLTELEVLVEKLDATKNGRGPRSKAWIGRSVDQSGAGQYFQREAASYLAVQGFCKGKTSLARRLFDKVAWRVSFVDCPVQQNNLRC